MAQTDIAIFRTSGLAARPPQKLQIHHAVNDGVVTVFTPCGNQLCDWIKQVDQMIGTANSAVTEFRISGQPKAEYRGIEIEEPGIVVLIRFLAGKSRGPECCPAAILFVVSS